MTYGQRSFFQPELARSYYLLARMFSLTGEEELRFEHHSNAIDIYRRLNPYDTREDEDITGRDIEKLICFASL